jgi:adenylate cyclase
VVSRTIVSQVINKAQPVITTNAEHDPRFEGGNSVANYALRSIVSVPLLVRGKVTGAIYADNQLRSGLFGEKEMELLQNFASQAAVAIENARLYEEIQTSLAKMTAMRDLLDNVFASISSGVITTNANNQITQINSAARLILGLTQPTSGLLQKPISEIWADIHNETLDAIREEGIEEIIEFNTEVGGQGTRNLSLRLTPLRNAATAIEGVTIVVDDLTEIRKREAKFNAVRRYLPPAMVDNIESIDGLGLGGERRVITCVFIDVRQSFPTTISPRARMEMLNRYLTVASDAIMKQNGVIDKYMANVVMGLFNTQFNPQEDHAWRALHAAMNMAEEFAQFYKQNNEPEGAQYFRVGINTGVATLGNVGSEDRREFTAIGDNINLTQRLLESAQLGQIVFSESCHTQCKAQLILPPTLMLGQREELQVKGRREAVRAYRIGYVSQIKTVIGRATVSG